MKVVHSKPAKCSRPRAFSLIELLVVIGIISLLLVAAVPIFTNNSNSARNASREIIKAYLQQARAHAIASGNATALTIPTLASDSELGARSLALVEVENTTGTYEPIQEDGRDSFVQRFGKLSGNFHFLSNTEVAAEEATVLDNGATVEVESGSRTLACRAIIFSSNGQIVQPASGSPIAIAIGQGAKKSGALVLTDRNQGQPIYDLLQINRLTGRARFYQPE